jgi:drug/metabolite transporter (DMT)-like permease
VTFATLRERVSRKVAKNRKDAKGKTERTSESMIWVMFALGAALSWGLYGPVLHKGQVALGNPFRALLCVGVAYFLIGVLVPVIALGAQGGLKDFTGTGITWATMGGTLGAVGALCIIYAFKSGGLPTYVMPLVFGGAPIVNVLFSMWLHPPRTPPNPLIYVGFVLVAAGAGLVLYFKPPQS